MELCFYSQRSEQFLDIRREASEPLHSSQVAQKLSVLAIEKIWSLEPGVLTMTRSRSLATADARVKAREAEASESRNPVEETRE